MRETTEIDIGEIMCAVLSFLPYERFINCDMLQSTIKIFISGAIFGLDGSKLMAMTSKLTLFH
jgi:hypothetical protein